VRSSASKNRRPARSRSGPSTKATSALVRLPVAMPAYPEYSVYASMSQRRALTLMLLGRAAFEIETVLTSDQITEVDLELGAPFAGRVALNALSRELRRLFNLVLLRDFDLSISTFKPQSETASEPPPAGVVSLFSGGVDSVCAVMNPPRQSRALRALFCSHTDQSKIRMIVDNLDEVLLKPENIELSTLRVPAIGKGRFRQTRGFLYLLTGSAVAAASRASQLIVSEVGTTMYQPRFGPLDQVTMTTHPYVVEIAEAVARLVLVSAPTIVLPFRDSTKAEIMADCPRSDVFPQTHSCISQRFGSHDGTCYGCVMRRLSAIVASVPDVAYARDPLLDSGAQDDNLIQLLDYCLSYLTDYKGMPAFRREVVELFGKHDLFRRYSLDVYGALHVLACGGNTLSDTAQRYYREALQQIGEAPLEARVEAVRARKARR